MTKNKYGFDSSKVNKGLYEDPYGGSYPVIVWHGKYTGNGSSAGYWSLDRAEAESAPGPSWEEAEIRFGSSPDAPLSPVWRTERLRGCVLGIRKRILIYGEDGGDYAYPWLTKKTDRVPGRFKAHFQIAVTLPNTGDMIYQVSLKGVSKTKAWSNPESGKYHDRDYPKGAELMLRDLASIASNEAGAEIPPLCTFWLDLVPFKDAKGKTQYIDIGYGTHVAVFTADISSGGDSGLDHRFVGMDLFETFQALRANEILDWELQWNEESEDSGEADPYREPVGAVEDEEIPF